MTIFLVANAHALLQKPDKYLKARADTSRIPIIALTGNLLVKDLRSLMVSAGCVALVEKPIMNYDTFRKIVEEVLAGRQR
jgi:CheY-like chemotaxis protein